MRFLTDKMQQYHVEDRSSCNAEKTVPLPSMEPADCQDRRNLRKAEAGVKEIHIAQTVDHQQRDDRRREHAAQIFHGFGYLAVFREKDKRNEPGDHNPCRKGRYHDQKLEHGHWSSPAFSDVFSK